MRKHEVGTKSKCFVKTMCSKVECVVWPVNVENKNIQHEKTKFWANNLSNV
jgi:hypothetical protein